MHIALDEMRALYAETIKEYNVSPLAVEENYVAIPTEEKFAEITECVKYLPSRHSTFLDVGTGMGIAPRFFQKLGCQTVTIDNPVTGGNGLRNAMAAGIKSIPCDIMNSALPLADDSIDCILFADVIEHLLHSPKFPLNEFRRVLRPGGVCVATTPNAMRLSVRLRVLLGYSNWPYIGDFFDSPYHGGHHHEYTIAEFNSVFERSNFEVINFVLGGSVASVNITSLAELQSRCRAGAAAATRTHPLISIAKIPIYLLERVFPPFRPQMLLVGRKT
jgi:SAM-dependent methyltransferase